MRLTIFTPLYNRREQIKHVYHSLLKQAVFNFEWIVIDDGSTDHPEDVFEHWKQEKQPFDIVFLQVENGGKHRAINHALKLARGEFFCICDSDDYFTEDGLGLLFSWLDDIEAQHSIAGVAGLKMSQAGKLLLWEQAPSGEWDTSGGKPKFVDYIDAVFSECAKYGLYGDKAEVLKTAVMRKYPFPEFEGENFLTESVVWNRMSKDGIVIRWHDQPIQICEYQEDGLTQAGGAKFDKNPKGFGLYLRENEFSEQARREYYLYYYNSQIATLSEDEIAENLGLEDCSTIKAFGLEKLDLRREEIDLMEESLGVLNNIRKNSFPGLEDQLRALLERRISNLQEVEAVFKGNAEEIRLQISNLRKQLDVERQKYL